MKILLEPESYYYLGYFYQNGYGVDKNKTKAEEYYTKAQTELSKYETKPGGYHYLLGKMYESGFDNGKIGKINYEKAAYHYSIAAGMQYLDAYYRLGYIDALQKVAEKTI